MGSSQSQPALPTAPAVDLASIATVPLDKAQELANQAQAQAQAAAIQAQTYFGLSMEWQRQFYIAIGIVALGGVGFLIYWLYTYFTGGSSGKGLVGATQQGGAPNPNASQGPSTPGTTATIAPPTKPGAVGATAPPAAIGANAKHKPSPTKSPLGTPVETPTFFTRVRNFFTSDNSGDLLPYAKDASSSSTIPAASAPLAATTQGGYGIQWWMFVNDWSYKFGEDKPVIVRNDPTNPAIMNPNITLHPTDNSLNIGISVFPNEAGSADTTGTSNDDVFTCTVPNIPLQTWFAVSMTVFEKNLDVYINGMLVKSCALPGVPKPATSDIQLNPDGGFSGQMCGLYHQPRMLSPSDASSFYSAGTSCSNVGPAQPASAMTNITGYNIQFGVTNPQGKQIASYQF